MNWKLTFPDWVSILANLVMSVDEKGKTQALQFIDECCRIARDEKMILFWEPIPFDISKHRVLVNIALTLLCAKSRLIGYKNMHVRYHVFNYLLSLFNQFYARQQYPQIYADIVLRYIHSHLQTRGLMDESKFKVLINSSFQYYNIKHINDHYHSNIHWQWINRHFFGNCTTIEHILDNLVIVEEATGFTRSENSNFGSMHQIRSSSRLYFELCLCDMLKNPSKYSIFDIIDTKKKYSKCSIFTLFNTLFYLAIENNAANVNTTSRLINKYAFCIANLRRNKIIEDFGNINLLYFNCAWDIIFKFYTYRQFDLQLSFSSCKCLWDYVRISKNTCASLEAEYSFNFFDDNMCSKFGDRFRMDNLPRVVLTSMITHCFISKNLPSFLFYLQLRQQYGPASQIGIDIFDTLGADVRAQSEWFSPQCKIKTKERIDFILKYCYMYDMYFGYFDQGAEIVHILQNQTFVTIIGNMLMLKECNNRQCKKKDIRLKRCKICRSVYYCSRKCQKMDWLSHRCVCTKLTSRDYSITLNKI